MALDPSDPSLPASEIAVFEVFEAFELELLDACALRRLALRSSRPAKAEIRESSRI